MYTDEDDELSEWDEWDEDDDEEETEEKELEAEEKEIPDLGIAEGLKGGIGKLPETASPTSVPDSEEMNLEEITEQPDASQETSFSEFMSPARDMPTATLPSSQQSEPLGLTQQAPQQSDNLEEIGAASSIGTPTGVNQQSNMEAQRQQYMSVYNQPDYTDSSGSNEKIVFDRMEDRGMSLRTVEDMRNVRPRVMIEDWHETGIPDHQREGENLRDYVVLEPGSRQGLDHRGLPFEEKTKYKELKRGKRI